MDDKRSRLLIIFPFLLFFFSKILAGFCNSRLCEGRRSRIRRRFVVRRKSSVIVTSTIVLGNKYRRGLLFARWQRQREVACCIDLYCGRSLDRSAFVIPYLAKSDGSIRHRAWIPFLANCSMPKHRFPLESLALIFLEREKKSRKRKGQNKNDKVKVLLPNFLTPLLQNISHINITFYGNIYYCNIFIVKNELYIFVVITFMK